MATAVRLQMLGAQPCCTVPGSVWRNAVNWAHHHARLACCQQHQLQLARRLAVLAAPCPGRLQGCEGWTSSQHTWSNLSCLSTPEPPCELRGAHWILLKTDTCLWSTEKGEWEAHRWKVMSFINNFFSSSINRKKKVFDDTKNNPSWMAKPRQKVTQVCEVNQHRWLCIFSQTRSHTSRINWTTSFSL